MTNPVTSNPVAAAAAAAAAASGNTAGATAQGLSTNYQDFLKLLTTQLQNQDPTAPADTNQVTTEIAQLSQVEQQINSNKYLGQLVSLFSAMQSNNAVSYIGKQVNAAGNQTELSGSQANLVYTLPAGASSATVTITNSTGQAVFSSDGTTAAGRNQLLWDGSTTAGTIAPDGVYNFKVTAKDASGAAVTATTMTSGVVTSVDTQNGTSSLSLGGISVPTSNVQSVYNAGTNPGA